MKIIAEMPGKKVLIEATKDEVANLLGYSSSWSNRMDPEKIVPGLVIHIDRMWNRLKKVESIPGTLRRLDELANSIKDAVAPAIPVVEHELEQKDD